MSELGRLTIEKAFICLAPDLSETVVADLTNANKEFCRTVARPALNSMIRKVVEIEYLSQVRLAY